MDTLGKQINPVAAHLVEMYNPELDWIYKLGNFKRQRVKGGNKGMDVLKEYSTDLALLSYNTVWLMTDSFSE